MRRGLELRYNSLNLLYGVNLRNGRSIRYLRLSDGRKLGIRFSDGSSGYDYSGNMTYKVTKGKIERESLAFGGGCIASTGSGSYEVRYYLRDHLGSVRAVRTASGRIVEENAYYPFGLRQRRQDYAVSCNRYRYNGKEEQQTFGYLDYGFRMYDACLGRWHSSDPLSERDPGISGYAYVKNAPLRYRDILGLTYTGYGDVPPYKYRWTPDGYELEEVVVTAPRGGSGYAFPILGAMGYSRQSGALWRTVFTWERYFESASDLRSVYGNASPNVSYDAPGPHSLYPDSHIPSGEKDDTGFDIDIAVNYLNEHAYPKYDRTTCGRCARAVRLSLEAGGINTTNHPISAKNYGPYLQKWGFNIVDKIDYSPLKGDVRVFQNYIGGSTHGHINMYNGNQWVSDFFENGFWPGRGYREHKAAFIIYRWSD